jgi:hypothetical protein
MIIMIILVSIATGVFVFWLGYKHSKLERLNEVDKKIKEKAK